ncbi:carbohydrate-binding protein [bacterium]|nr:carbohydrate-binding protein [bacterium]
MVRMTERFFWMAGITLLAASSASAREWQLVWADEFNGTSIDGSKWTHEVNGAGGGNNELQYYTARSQNSFIRDGKLVIRAIKETYTGPDGTRGYTSARLNSRYKGDWVYGRIEARLKVPGRQGLWPAFWMLPSDYEYGGWAASGEIDIMEHRGDLPSTLYSTIHHGGTWPNNTYTGSSMEGPDFTLDFHEFAVEWDPTEIRWYLDGNQIYSVDAWYSTSAPFPAPFNKRFHVLLNLAVGGNFLPNPPDNATYFPREYEIDWVRVYTEVLNPNAQSPFGGTVATIPGIVEAADFDLGGQDVAYRDTTVANTLGAARLTESVDLEVSSDSGASYTVGAIEAGEWLEYTVNVQQAGSYLVTARVASATSGGALTAKMTDGSGQVRSAYAAFAATGSWTTWQSVELGRMELAPGTHTLRVVAEASGFNLSTLDFSVPPQGPYGAGPQIIPGKVAMQDYDTGGEGVAYHDNDAANIGTGYRPSEGVDLGQSFDIDGAFSIGWFEVGEWVEYTVSVENSGTYEVFARTASESQSGTLGIQFSGPGTQDSSLSGTVPATGGWTTWQSTSLGTMFLGAGTQVMRLQLNAGAANVNYLDFVYQAPPSRSDMWLITGS